MKKVGDGTRILNFLVDGGIIFTLSYFTFGAWNWYVLNWGYQSYKFGWFFAAILLSTISCLKYCSPAPLENGSPIQKWSTGPVKGRLSSPYWCARSYV
jgi:hypothetical protein